MKTINASDFNEGKVSPADIKKWFGENVSMKGLSVLRFHSLYFEIIDSSKDWTDTLNKALRWSDYRQLQDVKPFTTLLISSHDLLVIIFPQNRVYMFASVLHHF